MTPSTLLLLNKPPFITSFDLVRLIKNKFRFKKVGHTGTLDPFATGLLILLTNDATQYSEKLMDEKKTYQGILKLGETTDSLDVMGLTTSQEKMLPTITSQKIISSMKDFIGPWTFIPPMYSAKKIKGQRLYELARRGIEVERPSITVDIEDFILHMWDPPFIHFEVTASKGTYVRTLACELAQKLGTVGHLTSLQRIRSGMFSLNEAMPLQFLLEFPYESLIRGQRMLENWLHLQNI